ncbi:MAG: eukaryotic-like serine/threonine-protein kinase, partial [Candidatus Hydrogenedentes bacterium]|nr:eukaryotic-like serine/threonine-protein kinase [Candidatus Hydrogenedentota bacterium]
MPSDPPVSRSLGGFDLQAELGRGGMGVVYLARERKTKRSVALKMLPSRAARDPRCVERFLAEGRAAVNLKHPNIVEAYETGQTVNRYFISMEYVKGTDLWELIRKRGRLPVGEALDIARQTAAALAYAHERGIIHRDVKPQNIMIANTGQVKVMDFGVAKIMWDFELFSDQGIPEESNSLAADVQAPPQGGASTGVPGGPSSLLTSGARVGTLMYMSPEQIRGDPLDARSDIYSLGITLYEMLTGSPPFTADNPAALMYQVTTSPLPDIRESNPDVPQELARLIGRMAASSPGLRPRTCSEVSQALTEIASDRVPGKRLGRQMVRGAVGAASTLFSVVHAVLLNTNILKTLAGVIVVLVALPVVLQTYKAQKNTFSVDLGNGIYIEMEWAPPGTFTIEPPQKESSQDSLAASAADASSREVTFERGFWLSKYEITKSQWQAIMDPYPHRDKLRDLRNFAECRGNNNEFPITGVSSDECQDFADKLSEVTSYPFRLPTEVEWEYAGRTGTDKPSMPGEYAVFGKSAPYVIGSTDPNAWGFCDMYGNVREWCKASYPVAPANASAKN